MIIIPDRSILRHSDPIGITSGLSGRFRIEALKVDARGQPIEASRRVLADWFPNIITNAGLNRIGTNSDWLLACQVGTGTATPLATDTGLAAFLAGSTTRQDSVVGAQGSSPFFGWRRNTYRFAAGVGTGNLSEVGIGWASTGATLFSRALILDGSGVPTVITKLADEVLDVTYEFRCHPPVADTSGNITITGSGTHAFVARAANVTSGTTFWAAVANGQFAGPSSAGGLSRVYNGAIGAVTSEPAGSSANIMSVALAAYSAGSFQRLGNFTLALNEGNLSDGIRSTRLLYGEGGGLGAFQTEFTPPIAKTAANTLTLTTTHTWARRP